MLPLINSGIKWPTRFSADHDITTAVNPLADLTRSQVWELDALGNFESLSNNDGTPVTSTHNLQNQVTGVGLASLSFDANGNMTVDEQGRTFIWDAWNRLVEVKQGSTTLVEYQYDGLKRRIVEDDGTSERHLYYSDQWQVLEERVDGDTVTQYVWSAVYVDAMILRDRDADANTGNGLEERIYVLHDANYNVTAIVDTSGEVLERYYYEAYGRAVYLDDAFALLPDAQSQFAWQHLHQGGRLDTITVNYHFRHRDLSPTLGRWISQDPIRFEAGDANLYRYVENQPVGSLDPSGLIIDTIWDVGNLAVGVGSLGYNIYNGNWWDASVDAGGLIIDGVCTAIPFLPGGAGMAIKAGRYGDEVIDLVEGGVKRIEVKTRPTPGADGATSRHLIEKIDGETTSVTHQVVKDGEIIHQHQTHIGKHGTQRRFPDEWVEHPTVPIGD